MIGGEYRNTQETSKGANNQNVDCGAGWMIR